MTIDRHARYLSLLCTSLGLHVTRHVTVEDEPDSLYSVLLWLRSQMDVCLLTGGLGPTPDDLTREVVARFLGESLVWDETLYSDIVRYFQGRGLDLPEGNSKQAYRFVGGDVLPNPHGTAVGLSLQKGGVRYVLLPGPVHELRPMVENFVTPMLRDFARDQVVRQCSLCFAGIGESELVAHFRHLIQATPRLTIAPYAHRDRVVVRVTVRGDEDAAAERLLASAQRDILDLCGDWCYSDEDVSLATVVVRLLCQCGRTVALAESCTGGQILQRLTVVPGSSQVVRGGWVAYHKDVKEQVVGVSGACIERMGIVSAATARFLARRAMQVFAATIGVGVTGVAGPKSHGGQPPGIVWISWVTAEVEHAVRFCWPGVLREDVQALASQQALFCLWKYLKKF